MKKIVMILVSVLMVINIFGIDLMAKEALVGNDNYLLFNYENSILYQQLDDKGKDVYGSLYKACIEFKPYYRYKGIYDESVYKAINAFCDDWPEFYWVNPSSTRGIEVNSFDVDFIYSYGLILNFDLHKKETYYEMINKGISIVKQLISEDEYVTVENIYNYVLDNCKYIENSKYNQDLRSALLYGDTVCMGYAKMFQFLCKLAGIECYTTIGRSSYGMHAWNYVKVDGDYYWVDCTWDDGSAHRYFLTDDDTRFSNVQTTDFEYPQVDHVYGTVVQNISEYDEASIIEMIGKSFANGKNIIDLRFTTLEDADACYKLLFSGVYRKLKKYYVFEDNMGYGVSKTNEIVTIGLTKID